MKPNVEVESRLEMVLPEWTVGKDFQKNFGLMNGVSPR